MGGAFVHQVVISSHRILHRFFELKEKHWYRNHATHTSATEAKLPRFRRVTNGLVGSLGVKCRSVASRSLEGTLWLKIAFVGTCIWFLFWDVWVDMAHDWWTDPTWSQGMLLPPLALYIAWEHRHRTLSEVAAPDRRGLALTAFACITFAVGKLASEFFLTRLSFVILLAGIVWTFWGLRRLKTLALPILLLATMVPLPGIIYNSIAAPLQLFVSDIATRIAQSVGISVFRDGNIIQLANVSLGVAEACSGISSLSALTVGSILLGYLLCSRLLSRIALFAIAIPLAIAVNVVRVAGTAVLADYNQELAMGLYHSFSGWLVFMIGFCCLYLLARMLHRFLDSK
jgi:exosortase